MITKTENVYNTKIRFDMLNKFARKRIVESFWWWFAFSITSDTGAVLLTWYNHNDWRVVMASGFIGSGITMSWINMFSLRKAMKYTDEMLIEHRASKWIND